MKLNKIVYDVRESLSQYQDDSNISDEYIIHLINTYREKILKNELNNLQSIVSPMTLQSFCIKLEEVSAYDCGIDFNCETVLRSVKPIPVPIKTFYGPAITLVKTVGLFSKIMSMISQTQATYYLNNKFAKSVYYFLDPQMYLYFISRNEEYKMIDCVSIQGVFSDPFELSEYSNCCDCEDTQENTCANDLEINYPITGDLVADVVTLVVERLAHKLSVPEDKTNNSDDQ